MKMKECIEDDESSYAARSIYTKVGKGFELLI